MHLSPDMLGGAVAYDAFERAWRGFVRDTDVFAFWDRGSRDLLRALGPDAPGLHLRAAYCNVTGTRSGPLAQVVVRERLSPPALTMPGRAATALAAAAAVARDLHELSG